VREADVFGSFLKTGHTGIRDRSLTPELSGAVPKITQRPREADLKINSKEPVGEPASDRVIFGGAYSEAEIAPIYFRITFSVALLITNTFSLLLPGSGMKR